MYPTIMKLKHFPIIENILSRVLHKNSIPSIALSTETLYSSLFLRLNH